MIGERNTDTTSFGSLTMRHYDINGNDIDAFYGASGDLVFVLDNKIDSKKTNVLLVINPDGDKKWDEILSGRYGVDLENVRPKQDNKYQKLDIEYSGLGVYNDLINAFTAGEDLTEHLNQLNILRESAVRHSAMLRLTAANETITKTNATIVRTKDAIIRLQERIKTLKSKLSVAKKEIGRVNTKQSASKILKIQSQIEATNEKLKRAEKRLESAQKRLETATVDAELASNLLNQDTREIMQVAPKSKSVTVKREYPVQTIEPDFEPENEGDDDMNPQDYKENFNDNIEDDNNNENTEYENNSGVKPLLDKDPEILNEDIAFKPIDFNVPNVDFNDTQEPEFKQTDDFKSEPLVEKEEIKESSYETPMLPEEEPIVTDFSAPQFEEEQKPVLDSMTPVTNDFNTDFDTSTPTPDFDYSVTDKENTETPVVPGVATPVENLVRPVSPATQNSSVPMNFGVASNAPVSNEDYGNVDNVQSVRSKPSVIYYLLLLILIALSVFTLWLYQKNMITTTPVLTQSAQPESVNKVPVAETVLKKTAPVEQVKFAEPEPVVEEPEIITQEQEFIDEVLEEQPTEEVPEVSTEPTISGAIPARVMTSGFVNEEEPGVSEEEIIINKPEYGVDSKYDDMFISEQDYEQSVQPQYVNNEEHYDDGVIYDNADLYYDDGFYDEEEAAYRGEQGGFYYSE